MPFDGTTYQGTLARRLRTRFGPNAGGWAQKTYYNATGSRMCLLGALYIEGGCNIQTDNVGALAMKHCADIRLIADAIEALGVKTMIGRGSGLDQAVQYVTSYNDSDRRTFSDIERVLEKMHELELAREKEMLPPVRKETAHAL